jgi:hypothetical protein
MLFKYSLISIVLIGLLACETRPVATFTEPQPAQVGSLSKFPKRLQGRYMSLENKTILTIGDELMQRIYSFDSTFHINQLDSTSRLSGDTLIDLKTNEKIAIRKDGDSLRYHDQYIDTLFRLNQDHVLKKFKGYYFLNTQYDTENWGVKKVQLSKGKLIVGTISSESDLEKLKAITESQQDTIAPYRFKATKKQFKQFVKNEGFSDDETFLRQKK